MKFIIDLFKKSTKGDNLRQVANPSKYDNKIAQLNTTSNNQYDRLTMGGANAIEKNNASLTQSTSKGSILPGR